MEENDLKDSTLKALIHVLYSIVYLLFIVPFDLWSKATTRLADQYSSGALKISNITGLWPFLSFIKTIMFEFIFDAAAFMCYIMGPIFAIIVLFVVPDYQFQSFLITLIAFYYAPISYMLTRDLLTLFVLLPIRKWVSWFKKPAQQLDIDLTRKNPDVVNNHIFKHD